MLRNIPYTTRLLAMLGVCVLSACGGGGDAPDASRVLQESELYLPITNPTGAVEQPGQTAVIGLQMNTSDLPPLPNVASKGVEDLWFEVKDAQSLQFALDADMLATIDRVEIRDQSSALLATVNATTSSATLSLAPGRYQALLYASAADTEPVPVFVQYVDGQDGEAEKQVAATTEKAQSQVFVFGPRKIAFRNGCRGCDLSGKNYFHWSFRGTDLTGANLSKAVLASADFTSANLSGVNLTGARLSRADLSRADLSGANLASAELSSANLFGANLTGANLSGASFIEANLSDANLTGAKLTGVNFATTYLSGAIFVDGRRCQPGSFGSCRQ